MHINTHTCMHTRMPTYILRDRHNTYYNYTMFSNLYVSALVNVLLDTMQTPLGHKMPKSGTYNIALIQLLR